MSMGRLIAVWLLIFTLAAWGRPHPVGFGPKIPSITTAQSYEFSLKRDLVLTDFGQRIDDQFQIPEGMEERVAFWFDVYTLYGSNHHVIHHSRYPWIVFEVIDTTSRVNSGKGPLWLRKQRAQKFVEARKASVRHILRSLAKNPRFLPSPQYKQILERIKSTPGRNLRQKLRLASASLRSQLGQRDFFHSGLEQSTHYLSHMEQEFESQGLPKELTRIPFVESSFNTKAKSRVGASGIWQIMPKTGRAYLTVNDFVDERNNPIKATRAAGRLLRSYHRALKKWPLTITSYNHGIGNIRKAIKAARSEELPTIIHRYHKGDFKFASSNFYACFLAALHAEKYNELFFNDIERLPTKRFVVAQLKSSIRTKFLLKKYKISEDEFLRYNLDLIGAVKRNSRLPRGLKVLLPEGVYKPLASNQIEKVRL